MTTGTCRRIPRSRTLFSALYQDLQEAYRFFRFEADLGQKSVWLLFVATCLQTAFLTPNISIIPGERANVLSGLLCALTLGGACALIRRNRAVGSTAELAISGTLAFLMIVSSLCSAAPGSASARAFAMLSSGLGGFWCARILLADEMGRRIFRSVCVLVLAAILCVGVACQFACGNVFSCLEMNPHPLASKILLLWFAPISYALHYGPGSVWALAFFFISSYLVFFLATLRSAGLIPVVLLLAAAALKIVRLKYVAGVLVFVGIALVMLFHNLPKAKTGLHAEPAYYRIENYFFSAHIAAQHPLLGIGLRAPRDEYVKEYEIRYPYVTKERFASSVKRVRTSENIFLSLMADVGLPFTALYLFALAVLIARLIRQVGHATAETMFQPIALLMPISAGLLHFQITDGLYLPQVSWFFHLLLGLIPWNTRPS